MMRLRTPIISNAPRLLDRRSAPKTEGRWTIAVKANQQGFRRERAAPCIQRLPPSGSGESEPSRLGPRRLVSAPTHDISL
jgi:hypothetical protein